jgi:hypothetical protein
MPLFNPFAAVLPPFIEASADALHIGHCANNDSLNSENMMTKKRKHNIAFKTD